MNLGGENVKKRDLEKSHAFHFRRKWYLLYKHSWKKVYWEMNYSLQMTSQRGKERKKEKKLIKEL